jgi:hypothetical protein
LQQVILYYALFLAIDWVSAVVCVFVGAARALEFVVVVVLQRFCYRQVMYYVMIKSVAMAIRGPVVGWASSKGRRRPRRGRKR